MPISTSITGDLSLLFLHPFAITTQTEMTSNIDDYYTNQVQSSAFQQLHVLVTKSFLILFIKPVKFSIQKSKDFLSNCWTTVPLRLPHWSVHTRILTSLVMDDWLSVSLGDLNLTPNETPGLGLSRDMGSSSSMLGLSRSVGVLGVWLSLTPEEQDRW